MSQTTTATHKVNASRRSKGSKFWIVLSFALSASILGWSFTLPFRQPGEPLISSAKSPHFAGPELVDRIEQRRTSAEEFREAAIAIDEEFMRTVAKKRQPKPHVPGIEEAKAVWNRRAQAAQRELEQLKDAPEGSIQWDRRQTLLESFEDAPL